MENAINVSISPTPVLLVTLAFQIWMIVAPIILIRKLNYLTALLEEQFYPSDNNEQSS